MDESRSGWKDHYGSYGRYVYHVLIDMSPEDSSSGLHHNLSTILASSRLLLTLINNVLDLGKIEANKMQAIDVSSTAVLSSIQASIKFCELFAWLYGVRLVYESGNKNINSTNMINDRDLTILANKLRFEEILINLMSNGIRYTNKATQVQISIRQTSIEEAVQAALNTGSSDWKCHPDALEQATVEMKQEMVTRSRTWHTGE